MATGAYDAPDTWSNPPSLRPGNSFRHFKEPPEAEARRAACPNVDTPRRPLEKPLRLQARQLPDELRRGDPQLGTQIVRMPRVALLKDLDDAPQERVARSNGRCPPPVVSVFRPRFRRIPRTGPRRSPRAGQPALPHSGSGSDNRQLAAPPRDRGRRIPVARIAMSSRP